jgi:hypothetical protein
MLSQRWNRFLICSASDEIIFLYARKWNHHSAYFERWFCCDFLLCWACVKIGYSLAENARNWLLFGWAWAIIGYSLAELARILVTPWLSMHENWLLAHKNEEDIQKSQEISCKLIYGGDLPHKWLCHENPTRQYIFLAVSTWLTFKLAQKIPSPIRKAEKYFGENVAKCI